MTCARGVDVPENPGQTVVRSEVLDSGDNGAMERATVLKTPRLEVTTWTWADLDDLYQLHSDPPTMRYIRNGVPESRSECAALLAKYISEQVEQGWTKWRVANYDGRLIGRAGFGSHRGDRELSYTIRRDRWGEGLATEVGSALVQWHRTHTAEALPLWAHVAVANPPSARVVVKLGFSLLGQEVLIGELCDVFCLRPR